MIDLIRRKRDGGELDVREIQYIAEGAARETVPAEQLAAWLMAAWIRGLSLDEIRALTLAMRDSGEKFSPRAWGAVDKHSTGGVGDKTSFLVAPIAAACGLAVPMISGRALGHTGGTLDKLGSIPGYRTALSLAEFEAVLGSAAHLSSARPVACPCRSRPLRPARSHRHSGKSRSDLLVHFQQKTRRGSDALVLDVKTGSGAFLRGREDPSIWPPCWWHRRRPPAPAPWPCSPIWVGRLAMLPAIGSSGRRSSCCAASAPPETKTSARAVAHPRRMDDSSGRRRRRRKKATRAEKALADGSALRIFFEMIAAQGGDTQRIRRSGRISQARSYPDRRAWQSGFIAEMDTTCSAGQSSALARGAKKRASPWTRTLESSFVRGAEQEWSPANR